MLAVKYDGYWNEEAEYVGFSWQLIDFFEISDYEGFVYYIGEKIDILIRVEIFRMFIELISDCNVAKYVLMDKSEDYGYLIECMHAKSLSCVVTIEVGATETVVEEECDVARQTVVEEEAKANDVDRDTVMRIDDIPHVHDVFHPEDDGLPVHDVFQTKDKGIPVHDVQQLEHDCESVAMEVNRHDMINIPIERNVQYTPPLPIISEEDEDYQDDDIQNACWNEVYGNNAIYDMNMHELDGLYIPNGYWWYYVCGCVYG